MDVILERVRTNQNQVTRTDIAELMASIDVPGEKLDDKKQAVRELYENLALGTDETTRVLDTLRTYGEY